MALSKERKSTFAVSLTNFLDSGCIVASSVALTAWAAAFGFGSTWTAILGAIGANAFGAAIGALIGGFLTDKFGRTIIYKYNLLVYALGVFLAMVAVNMPMVVIGVVLSGLSVGAGVPASWSYISETSGETRRASNIGISQFAWSCGPAIIFILSLALSFILPGFAADGKTLLPAGTYGPFDGMLATRILFFVLFVVALIAWNLQRQLDESADWAAKNQADGKPKVGFGRMMGNALKNATNVKTIIFLVAVYLTWNLAAGTNGQFMPYLYAAAGNIDSTGQSLLGVVQWVIIAVCSLAIFSKFGDKVPHRILFGLSALLALLSWIAIAVFGLAIQSGDTESMGWVLWVYVILWGISAGFSAQCFYALWGTELFPTQYRGGVQGIMFFLVRGALGIWSLVGVGAIMGDISANPAGFFPAAVIMCVVLLISLVVGVIWCPKTQGKTLDQITKERYGDDEMIDWNAIR